MLYKNITASGAVNQYAGQVRMLRLTINKALTGTIIISDETGTAGTPLVATITNPAVGDFYDYFGLQTGVTINPSGTTDITANMDLSRSGI